LIQEDDFKEYVSTGGNAGSEFGDSKPVRAEPAKESATKARANKEVEKPAKAKKVEVEDDGEGSPF
jgi:hypothetical protein